MRYLVQSTWQHCTGWVRRNIFPFLPRFIIASIGRRRRGVQAITTQSPHTLTSTQETVQHFRAFVAKRSSPTGWDGKVSPPLAQGSFSPVITRCKEASPSSAQRGFQHQWKMRGKVQGFPSPLHHWAEKSRRRRSNPPRFPHTFGRLLCGAREE